MPSSSAASSRTFSGCVAARLFRSPWIRRQIVELRLRDRCPSSVFVFCWILGPLLGRDVLPLSLPESDSDPACSTRRVAAGRRRAEQRRQHVLAVARAADRTAGEPTSAANDAMRSTWEISASETPGFTRAGQRTTNGTRVPAFEAAVLAAAERPGRRVIAQLLDGLVPIPVVDDGAVVAREEDERVRRRASRRSSVASTSPTDQSSCAIASPRGPIVVAPAKRGCGTRGTCGSCGAKNRKNGFAAVLLDERGRLAREDVRHVLVFPERGLAAGHVADAADAVDDGLVVAVAGMDLEEVRVAPAGRPVAERLAVAHGDRIGRIETDDAAVLDVDGRHAVAGGGHDERGIEADVGRARSNLAVPVRSAVRAETEVPLPHHAGRVTGPLKHAGQRRPARLDDERRVARQNAGAGLAPGVLAGEHRVSGGRAGRSRRVGVGEPEAFAGEAVDVRRLQTLVAPYAETSP